MPPIFPPPTDILHAIQLALAPVFLLTGIAALLNVMTGRLARIIDRGRHFERHWAAMTPAARGHAAAELRELERRRRLTSHAIHASTAAALMVCLVVASLFLEALFGWPLRALAAVCFIASMALLTAGLGAFLREVELAMRTVRIPTLGTLD